MRSTWASTGCTMARRCGRSWYSDVMPFEYMKAMAELGGRGGQDFAAAQQNFFANMAKAAGQETPSGVPRAGLFDPQSPKQAHQAFAKLWASAVGKSQTISRYMPA